MTCIKTGCHAYLVEYDEWVYGDAHEFTPMHDAMEASYNGFQIGDIYAFRVSNRTREPQRDVKHFTINRILADWRDAPYGTILAGDVINHGYEGIPL